MEEDLPQLSAETFLALQEFYREQEEKELSKNSLNIVNNKMNFDEDWVRILI